MRSNPFKSGTVSLPMERTVLVVDDDKEIREVLRTALSSRYNVVCAKNTREADVAIQEQAIHVVICDHYMPDENGLQFLMRLRLTHPSISRILLTGCAEPDTMLTAINQSGVQRYLVKPLSIAELRKAVDDAMRAYDSEARSKELGKENADLRNSLQRVLSRTTPLHESPAKVIAASTLGLLALLAVAFLAGLLAFVLLYALKSALGIDFLPNWSHTEVL